MVPSPKQIQRLDFVMMAPDFEKSLLYLSVLYRREKTPPVAPSPRSGIGKATLRGHAQFSATLHKATVNASVFVLGSAIWLTC